MYKVIIVDDEMIVRHAVKTLIKWDRFEFAGSAANGIAALELAARTGAEIIITDIKMPEMDGLELIKKLVAGDFRGEVLVLSNYNDFELVREALKCGAHDYMLKLTLKSEAFMAALDEMAAKLDARGHQLAPQGLVKNAAGGERTSLYQLLNRAEHGESIAFNRLTGEEHKGVTGLNGACCYSFAVYAQEEEEQSDIADILDKLADGLFPGKQHGFVIPAGAGRYSLIITVPRSLNPAEPEEVAHRLVKLAEMYYGLHVNVFFGQAATSFEELLLQLRLNKEADELRFYTRYTEGCCSSLPRQSINQEGFHQSEARLRESLRKSGGSAVELWVESSFLLVESAAAHRVPPRTLKRILSGSIWGLSNTTPVRNGQPWNEQVWIEKMEAAESDSGLLLLIKDSSDQLYDVIGRIPAAAAIRGEIKQALSYLEEHYAERVAISDVAAHVGLSEPYLCQVFKTETGSSILTRLNEIRLNKAHEMLASGNYLVKQVAIEVGIPDPFYFNRLFRKRYGVAPKNVKG
ncbi:response regulator transcription factor [Paenibacillus sp. JDR-2]|uniref:response regulator transcription factor n=1 Tax=Paenibacillus sp. (strain JDR-2) TaxID=324057 RepID=UPI000166A637|nr:response regulator [Paenibacillus sp. JDR-2]ACT00429.1 two component transcriptional regulator, AraC family [Paenibacillus sp. JDR-2]